MNLQLTRQLYSSWASIQTAYVSTLELSSCNVFFRIAVTTIMPITKQLERSVFHGVFARRLTEGEC